MLYLIAHFYFYKMATAPILTPSVLATKVTVESRVPQLLLEEPWPCNI